MWPCHTEKMKADIALRLSNRVDTPRLMSSLVAQSGSFLHAFISGEEKKPENLESEKTLFNVMYSEATKTPGLGPHCDGFPWPQNFNIDWKVLHGKSDQPTKNITTLTGLRLVSDILTSGFERHADAISKSMMYIPVFTSESLQQLCQQNRCKHLLRQQ